MKRIKCTRNSVEFKANIYGLFLLRLILNSKTLTDRKRIVFLQIRWTYIKRFCNKWVLVWLVGNRLLPPGPDLSSSWMWPARNEDSAARRQSQA